MPEDLEAAVRRVELAEARLEVQVNAFKDALISVQAMMSKLLADLVEVDRHVRVLEVDGSKLAHSNQRRMLHIETSTAGRVEVVDKELAAINHRMAMLEGKLKAVPTPARFWIAVGAIIGLVLGIVLPAIGGTGIGKIIEKAFGG